jgi:hypothetical protein
LAAALGAKPLAAAVIALVISTVGATRLVDVLVPPHALEGTHRAEPDVEVGLSLRANLGIAPAA